MIATLGTQDGPLHRSHTELEMYSSRVSAEVNSLNRTIYAERQESVEAQRHREEGEEEAEMQDMTYAEASLVYAHSDSRVNTELKMPEAKVPEKTKSLDLSANVVAGHRSDQQTREDFELAAGHHIKTDQSELRRRTPRNVDGPAADREQLEPNAEGTDANDRAPTHCGGHSRVQSESSGNSRVSNTEQFYTEQLEQLLRQLAAFQ